MYIPFGPQCDTEEQKMTHSTSKKSIFKRKAQIINTESPHTSKVTMVQCRACFGELKIYFETFKFDVRTYLSSSRILTPDMTVADFCTDYLVRSHRKRAHDDSALIESGESSSS